MTSQIQNQSTKNNMTNNKAINNKRNLQTNDTTILSNSYG
jgi:hypothetical protein